MATYSLSQRTTSGTAASAAWEIKAAATGTRPKIFEIGITINAATASVFGLGRPAAVGVTPTSPVTFLGEDNADTSLTTAALAWGTGPTVPVNFFRRISLPAVVGAGVIWTFPRGLVLPLGGGLVLWNIGTDSVADVYAVIDE